MTSHIIGCLGIDSIILRNQICLSYLSLPDHVRAQLPDLAIFGQDATSLPGNHHHLRTVGCIHYGLQCFLNLPSDHDHQIRQFAEQVQRHHVAWLIHVPSMLRPKSLTPLTDFRRGTLVFDTEMLLAYHALPKEMADRIMRYVDACGAERVIFEFDLQQSYHLAHAFCASLVPYLGSLRLGSLFFASPFDIQLSFRDALPYDLLFYFRDPDHVQPFLGQLRRYFCIAGTPRFSSPHSSHH